MDKGTIINGSKTRNSGCSCFYSPINFLLLRLCYSFTLTTNFFINPSPCGFCLREKNNKKLVSLQKGKSRNIRAYLKGYTSFLHCIHHNDETLSARSIPFDLCL